MDAQNETIFTTRFYREFGNFTAWCLASCKSLGRIVLSWAWRSITGWYSQISDKKGLNIDCVKFYDFLLNFRIVEFSSNFSFFCTVLFFRSCNAMCYTPEREKFGENSWPLDLMTENLLGFTILQIENWVFRLWTRIMIRLFDLGEISERTEI